MGISILHGALLLSITHILLIAQGYEGVSAGTLLRWDAVHYSAISDHGYSGESSAFFPLFPYLWKALGVDPFGMAMVNAVIYVIASHLLVTDLNIPRRFHLAFVVLPSVFFLFTPYTEALFFLFCVFLLISIRKGSVFLTALALFACTLTRPAFTALLPAMILMTLLSSAPVRNRVLNILTFTLTAMIGLAVVALIQYAQTGEFFGFYNAQGSYGNTFKLPDFPLGSWGGGQVVRLDAMALLIGLTAAVYVVMEAIRKVLATGTSAPPIVLVSAGYIAGVSAIALFLRSGELYSLNRFIFPTPFILVFMFHILSRLPKVRSRTWAMIWTTFLAYTLLFGSFVHIQTFSLFAVVSLLVTIGVFTLSDDRRVATILFWPWIATMFCVQVLFFSKFLLGEWVA